MKCDASRFLKLSMKFPRKFRKPDKPGGLPIPPGFQPDFYSIAQPQSTKSATRPRQKAGERTGTKATRRYLNVTRSTTKTTMHGARIDGKVSARVRRDRTCDPVHPPDALSHTFLSLSVLFSQ